MSNRPHVDIAECVSIRECCSAVNIKSMLRGYIYVYDTPRHITVRPILLAILCRIIQFLIVLSGIFYFIMYKNSYQITDSSIISFLDFKAKGVGYYPIGKNRSIVIDHDDFFLSSSQNGYFIMTNFIRTDQEYTRCPELSYEKEAICTSDIDCQSKGNSIRSNGKWTGRCILDNHLDSQTRYGLCEFEGWCPSSDSHVHTPSFDSLNYTIFIKNRIVSPYFRAVKDNIALPHGYLTQCNYNPMDDKICPMFRIGTILDIVEPNLNEQLLILKLGGIVYMNIHWNCNLDRSIDHCKPSYLFGRFDRSYRSEIFSFKSNQRIVSYWKDGNHSYRTVIRAYGLQFIISVTGNFGRFSFLALLHTIVSIIIALCIPTFVFDIIALYLYRRPGVKTQLNWQNVSHNSSHVETLPKHQNENQYNPVLVQQMLLVNNY